MDAAVTSRPSDAGDLDTRGRAMHALAAELYPLHRSMTGEGVRRTLEILGREVAVQVHEIPSGTAVFDWEIPDEWVLREAYVADGEGRRVIDVARSNLHVVAYSRPVRARMRWRDLRVRVHTLPDRPAWIPYRTAYWRDEWGFCLDHATWLTLDREPDREYEVVIDAALEPGALTYGEVVLAGEGGGQALVWAHCCHPSLANDNLSGIVVATELARWLAGRERRLTWRIVFAPVTIGAIAWLWTHRESVDTMEAGLVLALLGGSGPFTYKRSRRGDAGIDRVAAHALGWIGGPHEIRPFEPFGYDERQFCSPGFDLPVGRLTRTPPGEFPEYHTSADDLAFARPADLARSWDACAAIVEGVEENRVVRATRPHGEPRLDRHGLYAGWGRLADADRAALQRAALWVLNLADGRHDLLAVAERAGLRFDLVRRATDALLESGLLVEEAEENRHRKEKE